MHYLIIFLIRLITDRDWTLSSLSSRIKRIFSRLWDLVRRLWKACIFLIKWIRRLFVLWTLMFCIWITCFWIWLLLSDLNINNQSLNLMVNPRIIIPLWILILSFSFWTIAWIFRLKWTPIKNRFVHFLALIIAIIWCIRIWAEWIWFLWMKRYTYNFPIELWNVPTSWYISIETMDRIDANKPKIYYELYRWDEFKAEFESIGDEWRPHHLHMISIKGLEKKFRVLFRRPTRQRQNGRRHHPRRPEPSRHRHHHQALCLQQPGG